MADPYDSRTLKRELIKTREIARSFTETCFGPDVLSEDLDEIASLLLASTVFVSARDIEYRRDLEGTVSFENLMPVFDELSAVKERKRKALARIWKGILDHREAGDFRVSEIQAMIRLCNLKLEKSAPEIWISVATFCKELEREWKDAQTKILSQGKTGDLLDFPSVGTNLRRNGKSGRN